MFGRFLAFVTAVVLATAAGAQSNYEIRSGDQLAIEVLEDPSLNRQVIVLPGGTVNFPLAGTISTSGRTLDDFQTALAAALAPNFAAPPTVFASVVALSAASRGGGGGTGGGKIDVYVMGEVTTPGVLEMDRGATLLQVLARTGGFTKFAATKRIQLRRANSSGSYSTFIFNYRALENGAQISGRTLISDGDVVVVPQRRLFE